MAALIQQTSPVSNFPTWIRSFVLLVAIIIAVHYVSQIWPLVWSGLFKDYWSNYDIIVAAFQGDLSWFRIVEPFGDHMLVLPRLLYVADFWLAHGTNYLIVCSDLLLMTGMALLIYQAVTHSRATTGVLPSLVLLLAVIHIFNHANTFNILYSSHTQCLMAAFFSLAGLYVFTRTGSSSGVTRDGLVFLCYLLGMLSSRTAWSLAPALALLLFLERRWLQGLVWAALAAGVHMVFTMSSQNELDGVWILVMLLTGWGLFADMHTGFMAPSFGDTAALLSGRLLIIAALLACVHFTWRGRHRGDSGLRFAAGGVLYALLTIIGISAIRAWMHNLPQGDRFQINVQLSCFFIALYWFLALPSVIYRGFWLILFTCKALAVNNLKYPEMQRFSAQVIAEHAEFMSGHASLDKQYPSGWGKDPQLFDAEHLFASQTLAYYWRTLNLVREHQTNKQILPCTWRLETTDDFRIVLVSTEAQNRYLPGYIVLLNAVGAPVGYGAATTLQDEDAHMQIWLRTPRPDISSGYTLHGESMQPCSLRINAKQNNP